MKVKTVEKPTNQTPQKLAIENPKKEFVIRLISIILTSFLMAMLIEIGRYGIFEFFTNLGSLIVWIQMLCVTGIISMVLSTMLIYLTISKKDSGHYVKNQVRIALLALVVTFLLSIVFAAIFNNELIMPLALSGLLISALVGRRSALIVNVLLNQAFYLSYMLQFGSDKLMQTCAALLTGIVGGTLMILIMGKSASRIKFLGMGFLVGLLMSVIGILSSLIGDMYDWQGALMSGLWSFLATFLSVALFLVIVPLFEMVFNTATNFRLYELTSFDQPLLKRLSKEAPGTFNHCLVVSSLSELCAIAIDENPTLVKACGMYHDVGKLAHPECFIENQKGGENPHDKLIPEVSVKLITDHAAHGYELCKKNRLPDIIAEVARQHHGTTAVNYFYYKVKSITDETVNKENFVYGGPKPACKAAAIIMIVDTVEAATRSYEEGFESLEEYKKFIHKLIKAKEEEGQFSECDLTMSELDRIEKTLAESVPNMYHKRIKYEQA